MLISEFYRKYKVSHQSVYEKTHRHENGVLLGHIKKLPHKSIDLDDFAVEQLMPKSVLIEEYRNRCSALSEENEKLKNQLSLLSEKIQKLKYSNIHRPDNFEDLKSRKYEERINLLSAENTKLENKVSVQHTEIIKLRSALIERRKKISELEDMLFSSKS